MRRALAALTLAPLAVVLLFGGCGPSYDIDTSPIKNALAGHPDPDVVAIAAALPPDLVNRLSEVTWDDTALDNPDVDQLLRIGAVVLDARDGGGGASGASISPQGIPYPHVKKLPDGACDCDAVLSIMNESIKAGGAEEVSFGGKRDWTGPPPPNCKWVKAGQETIETCVSSQAKVTLTAADLACMGHPYMDLLGFAAGCRNCQGTACGQEGATCAGIGPACCAGLKCDMTEKRCFNTNAQLPPPSGCGGRGSICGGGNLPCCSNDCNKATSMCNGNPVGDPCNDSFDCATDFCSANMCVCIPTCGPCAQDKQCCSGSCNFGKYKCD